MANISFGTNILPKNNTVTIGNSEAPWKIYTSQLNGQAAETALLPSVSSTDNGKVLQVSSGSWTPTTIPTATSSVDGLMSSTDKSTLTSLSSGFTQLLRQFYTSTSSVSVTLGESKNYIIYTCGTAGTNGAIMDSTNGCLVFVSDSVHAVIHKGSNITVSIASSVLTVSSTSAIKMAVIEI